MHDPVRQTGPWLKARFVQGPSNYYRGTGKPRQSPAYSGNRLIGSGGIPFAAAARNHPISGAYSRLGNPMVPQPRVLHPYPAIRFADNHPR